MDPTWAYLSKSSENLFIPCTALLIVETKFPHLAVLLVQTSREQLGKRGHRAERRFQIVLSRSEINCAWCSAIEIPSATMSLN